MAVVRKLVRRTMGERRFLALFEHSKQDVLNKKAFFVKQFHFSIPLDFVLQSRFDRMFVFSDCSNKLELKLITDFCLSVSDLMFEFEITASIDSILI